MSGSAATATTTLLPRLRPETVLDYSYLDSLAAALLEERGFGERNTSRLAASAKSCLAAAPNPQTGVASK
jgi:hypothetical protein